MKNVCLSVDSILKEFSVLSGFLGIEKRRFRPLFLFATDNSREAICLYSYLVRKKIPIMLVAENTAMEALQRLLLCFRPSYLLYPEKEGKPLSLQGYQWKEKYGHYLVGKRLDIDIWREQEINQEIAVLLPTSGSTGGGKYVMLTYGNLLANAESIIHSLNIEKEDRGALMLPMNYSYGLSVVNSYLRAGGCLLLPEEKLVQKGYWDFLETMGVNAFCGVPYTYEIMRKLRIFDRPLKDLKLITQAGGAMDRQTKCFFLEKIKEREIQGRNIAFAVMYGQTEATARMSSFFLNRHPEKIESVGKAIPGGSFFIQNQNREGVGEIVYQGPNVSLGYADSWKALLERESPEQQKKRNGETGKGRILQTGDLGWLDQEGYLYLTGRKSRFVKVKGYRVNLDDLQAKLSAKLERNVICVNGRTNRDMIYVAVCPPALSGQLDVPRKKLERVSTTETERLVSEIMTAAHIGRKDYRIVETQGIPRKENGKTDYIALQKRICAL